MKQYDGEITLGKISNELPDAAVGFKRTACNVALTSHRPGYGYAWCPEHPSTIKAFARHAAAKSLFRRSNGLRAGLVH
jgi:hypothetical protein